MVGVVVVGTCPEWQEVVQAPREFVTRVRVNGLGKTEHDPHVHGQDVQVLGNGAPEDWRDNGAQAKDHYLEWRSIFSGETKGSRILVVDFVDVLVKRTPVQCAVRPVVPSIFKNKENGNLVGHGEKRRERHACFEADKLRHGMEEPDLRQLNCEVAQQHELRAVPLLLRGRHLLL